MTAAGLTATSIVTARNTRLTRGRLLMQGDAAIRIRYIHGEDVGSSDTDTDGVPDVFIHRQRP